MRDITRVAILGSGVMGGAIAGLVAGCGIPCLMLDRVPPELTGPDREKKGKRNGLAVASKTALAKTKPSPIYTKSSLNLIEVGNFEDDFARIAECDWICEVVKEDVEVKRALFENVAKYRSPGSIVSTNTSGILIRAMAESMGDDDMRRHFLGTHFFNPPRYLKLLELIAGPDTLPEVMERMAAFGENVLGKGIVYAKDTPNFITNRILTFTVQYLLREMVKEGLTVEEVDALTGSAIGHASSGTFRTVDLVGLDTFTHVVANVRQGCPQDEALSLLEPVPFVEKMVEKGYLGEKSGSGFYKKTNDAAGKKIILSIDPATLEYKPQITPHFACVDAVKHSHSIENKVRTMYLGEDAGSKFLWRMFAQVAVYAGNRLPEIADDVVNVDRALKWGFAWEQGIFETWDTLGFNTVCDHMESEGLVLPPIAQTMKRVGAESFYRQDTQGQRLYFDMASETYKPEVLNSNVIRLDQVKRQRGVVLENEDASLIDLGDGILNCEFHCKLNVLGPDVTKIILAGVDLVNEGTFDGMVLGNQGPHFSAGANLMLILGYIRNEEWESIRKMILGLQNANMRVRFCRGPVVAAPHGYTFGGGMEVVQHAARAVIAAETYAGLVEVGVGLLPAAGGTKEMLRRAMAYVPESLPDRNPLPFVRWAFENIAMAKVSTSGRELAEMGYLSLHDPICFNPDQLVKRAKDVCRGMVIAGYRPPQMEWMPVVGEPARAAFRAGLYNLQLSGQATEHDVTVAMQVAHVLTGGNRRPGTVISEKEMMELEIESFLSLCGMEKTQERIAYMLMNNKPLRN